MPENCKTKNAQTDSNFIKQMLVIFFSINGENLLLRQTKRQLY